MANRIKFKSRRYFGWFHPILTWEHHCFGYRKAGDTSRTVSDGYETDVSVTDDKIYFNTTEKTHVVRRAYFQRHEEYPTHPLFSLLEILMNIVSLIRVFLGKFLIIGYILMLSPDMGMAEMSGMLGNLILTLYGASFVIPILGTIARSTFGLDQQMDDLCDENGWKRWSEYQDE